MTFGPPVGGRGPAFSSWGKGSAGSRLSQTKEETTHKNRFEAFSGPSEPSEPASSSTSFDSSRRGASRSVGNPGRSSRGPSADERRAAVEAVMGMAGKMPVPAQPQSAAPASVMQKPSANISDEKAAVIQAEFKGQPSLSSEAVEKAVKPLFEEFLNNCDFEVCCTNIPSHAMLNCISLFRRPMPAYAIRFTRPPSSRL
jgi:hypothetical protein